MPTLIQSLQTRDLGHLRIVAGLWGLELGSAENDAALKELVDGMLNSEQAVEVADTLPNGAGAALAELLRLDGRMPWAAFIRRFGEIRETGPGRRDREMLFLHPVSTAEVLFYRGLLARAFFDTPNGAQEFAYIPEDLADLLGTSWHYARTDGEAGSESAFPKSTPQPLGRLATPRERAVPIPMSDVLLDDAATLLAALRMGMQTPDLQVPEAVVADFLEAAGILSNGAADLDRVRIFLETPRPVALNSLAECWRTAEPFNELHQLPGLVCEGEWTNDPLATRKFLLRLLEPLPVGKWWSLGAFIQDIKNKHPDFQRPVGDYDSWFIKRIEDGSYLRGFESWDAVDGALIRYILTGPMAWLGLLELAAPSEGEHASAFRINHQPIQNPENGKVAVASNGRIHVPRLVPLAARYLLSRFCEWDAPSRDGYNYHVTTASLKTARENGLKVNQLLSLLAKNARAEIPPAFIKALNRWETRGTEARVETQTILRVSRPEVLEELRKSRAGRFLGEMLGPVTIIVKKGAQAKVLAALTELGLLAEVFGGEDNHV